MKSVYKTLTPAALEPASQTFVEVTAESPSPDASPRHALRFDVTARGLSGLG